MSNFEQPLQTTLQGVNEGYRQASADLHQEVAAASESITRLTGGAARLVLNPHEEAPSTTTYQLMLEMLPPSIGRPEGDSDPLAPKRYALVTLRVPSSGYPIDAGNRAVMQDRTAIAAFLTNMASRQDSPLVLYLAFHTRRKLQSQT